MLPASPISSPLTVTPSRTVDPTRSSSPQLLEYLNPSRPAGFSHSIESVTGQCGITAGPDGVRFYNPAGDRRTEVASGQSYGEGDTIWIEQHTVLEPPWPANDTDTNFVNWVARDSGGYGAAVQIASQASRGHNRLHAWIYPLGSATRTGSMDWKAALVHDAPLPPTGSEIAVVLGLTLSTDPARGRYELWINGVKVAAGVGRTLFWESRVYGKFGIYGAPSTSDRSATVTLWRVTGSRPF